MTDIVRLPLEGAVREEFVAAANEQFEAVVERMEPDNPSMTTALWDAGYYIDNYLFNEGMLPISRDYALSIMEATLIHYVIGLAMEADRLGAGDEVMN